MSESDSGVDTGSESNESMSVESPPRSDDDKDSLDGLYKPNLNGFDYPHIGLCQSLQSVPCSYGYSDYGQHDFLNKIKPRLQRKNAIRVKRGIYPKTKNYMGERRLRQAANFNAIETVQNLLDIEVDPCAADERQRTPLHFAACRGFTEVARLLIERGADTNQKDIIGNTPLHLAACTSNIEMITLLLKAGSDVNALDNSGRSPLHLAESKLKLLQMNKTYSSSQLKDEVVHVLEMMQVYLQRSGKTAEVDLLNAFSNRLQQHQTREEVDNDVTDLLSSLSHLSLQKS